MVASTLSVAPSAVAPVAASDEDQNCIIERFLPLVGNIVGRIKLTLPPHIDADDLYSAGVTGLCDAVRKYESNQIGIFAIYAATRIRGAILDELRHMDKCPRRTRAKMRRLKEAENELEQRFGRPVTDEEIRIQLGLSPHEYAKLKRFAQPIIMVNLDQMTEHEETEGGAIHEFIGDSGAVSVRDRMDKAELIELVLQRIAELPDTQRKILGMRYFERMRFREIAVFFGVSETRICQIHDQTILSLRAWIRRVRDS